MVVRNSSNSFLYRYWYSGTAATPAATVGVGIGPLRADGQTAECGPEPVRPGQAVRDILDGFYDLDGTVPCQVDGGLKCFGHPIGASGLRMLYEMYLQLHGRAEDRQIENPKYGLTHNLGGFPANCVIGITIWGNEL